MSILQRQAEHGVEKRTLLLFTDLTNISKNLTLARWSKCISLTLDSLGHWVNQKEEKRLKL